jgi:hypothetical protein
LRLPTSVTGVALYRSAFPPGADPVTGSRRKDPPLGEWNDGLAAHSAEGLPGPKPLRRGRGRRPRSGPCVPQLDEDDMSRSLTNVLSMVLLRR